MLRANSVTWPINTNVCFHFSYIPAHRAKQDSGTILCPTTVIKAMPQETRERAITTAR